MDEEEVEGRRKWGRGEEGDEDKDLADNGQLRIGVKDADRQIDTQADRGLGRGKQTWREQSE